MSEWDAAEPWYSGCVGEKGHYYHRAVVLPNVLRLLHLKAGDSLLDIGCGQGVLSRHLPPNITYHGIDVSQKLIAEARRQQHAPHFRFDVIDATGDTALLQKTDFDKAVFILSLQNMAHGEKAIATAKRHLKNRAVLLLVLNHPCFRIPRQSGWGVDAAAKIQYRRMNCYLTPLDIPLQIHPAKGQKSETFYSYHHPLSDYFLWLTNHGFSVETVEEWVSDKKSEGAAARMEDRARKEIPLFLTLKAKLFKKT